MKKGLAGNNWRNAAPRKEKPMSATPQQDRAPPPTRGAVAREAQADARPVATTAAGAAARESRPGAQDSVGRAPPEADGSPGFAAQASPATVAAAVAPARPAADATAAETAQANRKAAAADATAQAAVAKNRAAAEAEAKARAEAAAKANAAKAEAASREKQQAQAAATAAADAHEEARRANLAAAAKPHKKPLQDCVAATLSERALKAARDHGRVPPASEGAPVRPDVRGVRMPGKRSNRENRLFKTVGQDAKIGASRAIGVTFTCSVSNAAGAAAAQQPVTYTWKTKTAATYKKRFYTSATSAEQKAKARNRRYAVAAFKDYISHHMPADADSTQLQISGGSDAARTELKDYYLSGKALKELTVCEYTHLGYLVGNEIATQARHEAEAEVAMPTSDTGGAAGDGRPRYERAYAAAVRKQLHSPGSQLAKKFAAAVAQGRHEELDRQVTELNEMSRAAIPLKHLSKGEANMARVNQLTRSEGRARYDRSDAIDYVSELRATHGPRYMGPTIATHDAHLAGGIIRKAIVAGQIARRLRAHRPRARGRTTQERALMTRGDGGARAGVVRPLSMLANGNPNHHRIECTT